MGPLRRGSALLFAAAALLLTAAHGARLFDTDTKDIDVRMAWIDGGYNVSADDQCNPNHPMNTYIIQFRPSMSTVLNQTCTLMNTGLGGTERSLSGHVQDFVGALNSTNTFQDYEELFGEPINYVLELSEEELQGFLTQLEGFWADWGDVLCTNTHRFLNAMSMITIGITDPAILNALGEALGDYIEVIERNQPVQLPPDEMTPDEMTSISRRNMLEATSLWGLDRSDQADLPGDGQYTSPGDGGNVRVYIIDTGVLGTHQDFNGRYKGGYDFVDNDANPTDCNGHGTHCAGTASGTTHGIAKRSDIYGVRVLDCSGSGSYDGVIAGINYVKQAKQSSPSTPMVASMSLGGGASTTVNNAINQLFAAGVPVAVAAGNDNNDACTASPAGADDAFTVGSTTNSDYRSSFSSYGSCMDIWAPGSSILSAYWTSDTATATLSGTSMACPHVAGGMAVFLSLNPEASAAEVYAAMLDNAAEDKINTNNPSDSLWTSSPNLLLQVQNFQSACDPADHTENADCVLSEWSSWSECSNDLDCGVGSTTRTRTVDTPAVGCGRCSEPLVDTEACSLDQCPQLQPMNYPVTGATQLATYANTRIEFEGDETKYEVSCVKDVTELPYSTASATRIELGDDASAQANFPYGSTFPFYGADYSSVYVSSNGHLTFGAGSVTYTANPANFFGMKMIAPYFVDLNPSVGGNVYKEMLADRAVISYVAVPYYPATYSVTFQVELVFATGAISFTYGTMVVPSSSALIGISKGASDSAGWTNTNLATEATASVCTEAPSPTDAPVTPPPTAPPPTPTAQPTAAPTAPPPTQQPTGSPTTPSPPPPTAQPTTPPPTAQPTGAPTAPPPTAQPTGAPTTPPPTQQPTGAPTAPPPTAQPTGAPTTPPPTQQPTGAPTTSQPTGAPTVSAPTLPAYTVSSTTAFSALDIAQFVNTTFNAEFRATFLAQLAAYAGVDVSAAYITSISSGSVQVESYIVTTSSTAASTLATGLSTDAAAVFTDASFASYGTPVASNVVTIEPTDAPTATTASPTLAPLVPTTPPTRAPTTTPPTGAPTTPPPTQQPTGAPTTSQPTGAPTTSQPTGSPSVQPTQSPSVAPTITVTSEPTGAPSDGPSNEPTSSPTMFPTYTPTIIPTQTPTMMPTWAPTSGPMPEHLATPAMVFPWGSSWSENMVSSQRGLYNPADDDLSTSANGARDALQMKQMTFYPSDREDTEFTAWNYAPTCLEDLDSPNMFARRGFRTPSRNGMPDDSFARIPLGQLSVKFGGVSYSNIYIGSNGYVTFGSGDNRYDNAVSAHYDTPRISVGFMDLDPSSNRGMIRYRITSEYVIVWYNNVPIFGNSRQRLKAQIRIWNDGRINMAWANVPNTNERMVVGVSGGTYPNMWENTDLIMLAEDNTGIDCNAAPELYEPPSPLLRNPIQEFGLSDALDSGNSGADQRYRDELSSFVKTAAVAGDNGFDMSDTSIVFYPHQINVYNVSCTHDISGSGFPEDIDAGNLVTVRDDSSRRIIFQSGKLFTFYGVSYNRMFVGSNGYIGFERPVNTPHSHRYIHYSRPRISALFADLDPSPSGGGSVRQTQMADKMVVSYKDVQLYGNSALKVSFQVELYFDSGVIRVSYGQVALTTSRMLVGLSGGSLFASEDYLAFKQRDLTAMSLPTCPDLDAAALNSFAELSEEWPKTEYTMDTGGEEMMWTAGDPLPDDALVLIDPSTGLSYVDSPDMCPLALAFTAQLDTSGLVGVAYPDDDAVVEQAVTPSSPSPTDAASGLRIGSALALAVTMALFVLA